MSLNIEELSIEEKRELLKKIRARKLAKEDAGDFDYGKFAQIRNRNNDEIKEFSFFREQAIQSGKYAMESIRYQSPSPLLQLERQNGEKFDIINFANFDYLGYSSHPKVIQAAKNALDQYGLGAAASPVIGGILGVHRELEETLLEFFGLEGHGITLFTSGFGSLVGSISAYITNEDHIVSDSSVHASIIDGSIVSQGTTKYFLHNDMDDLESILKKLDDGKNRILICSEGVYSPYGDYGDIENIVKLGKKYGSAVLVDEAHSILLTGAKGRGVCEELGLLEDVDMIVGSLSKSFAGVGGFLLARKDIADYVNIYARNRMFSCALDPAVTAGLIAVLNLAMGEDGEERRGRLKDNANYLRSLLKDHVDIKDSVTWIIPVAYGADKIRNSLLAYLHEEGLGLSMMSHPAVPKNKGVVRFFVTSEHTREQLKQGADIILKAAEKFNFFLD